MSDDIKVEIIYPEPYVKKITATMSKFSQAVALLCKAVAILGEDKTSFRLKDISVLQVHVLERVFRKYGVVIEHELERADGQTVAYMFADVSEFRRRMEEEEDDYSTRSPQDD